MNVQSMSSSEVADAKALRRAFGTFATGVTVVTTGGPTPHAMTANSFTSVSLDPPLVLVCVDRSAVMHRCLTEAGAFAVSVLAAHQEEVARHFADRGRTLGAAQFHGVDCVPGTLTGAPLLEGTVTRLECELWRAYDGGDHTIFVGKVLSMERLEDQDALLLCQGKFRRLTLGWKEATA